jgi:ABC-2 type transport system permease protein
MAPVISVANLSKTYASGFQALKGINLEIQDSEIFALLGPNGAGKTTLIGIICGIVNPSEGAVSVAGHDIIASYRAARSMIGLVPQELATDAFETVWATASFSRGLFGKKANPAHIEKVLKELSLWDKKDSKIITLSGGMKRRVMIAKALSHEPQILFLDEPTAGVDVELRKDMWEVVRGLRASGVTIILTTHYIEEAEQMADRIGVINHGELILVEDKDELMRKLGRKQLTLNLHNKLAAIPSGLEGRGLELSADGRHHLPGPQHDAELARGHLRQPGASIEMNLHAVKAIYLFEMARTWRTLMQSIVSPVLSTSLYFVVFGAAIGSRIAEIDGVSYGAFIVPGLVMLSLLTQSIANASFGIYFPKFVGTIYELLSAPISPLEIVLGYVGAAATKSVILGLIILATAGLFVPLRIAHPFWMIAFLVLTAATFSLFGFIIGIWADGFEKLQVIPLLVITPLTFLGGSFYSVSMLPPFWQTVTMFNPVVYLMSGFRWSFYDIADVGVGVSLAMTLAFLALCLGIVWWIFRTGYRLKA